MNKKNAHLILFLLLLSTVFVIFVPTVSAQRGVEISYPPIPGAEPPTTIATRIEVYAKYLIYLLWAAVGLISLIVIVIAGARYVASVGNPTETKEAKSQISSALLGMFIILISVVLVRTINPAWLTFNTGPIPLPIPTLKSGVLFCEQKQDASSITTFFNRASTARENMKRPESISNGNQIVKELNKVKEDISKNCYLPDEGGDFGVDYENRFKQVFLVPVYKEKQFGVIIFENSIFNETGGKAEIFWAEKNELDKIPYKQVEVPKISSFMLFDISFSEESFGGYVFLFEEAFFNTHAPPDEKKGQEIFGGDLNWTPGDPTQTDDVSKGYWDAPPYNPKGPDGFIKISSMQIEGGLFVVFSKNDLIRNRAGTAPGDLDFYSTGDDNLNDNKMGSWRTDCVNKPPELAVEKYPCATGMTIIKGSLY